MLSAVEPIIKSYAFNLEYARNLVSDIREDVLYRSIDKGLDNHPAFTLGHLCVASALIAQELGAPYDIPARWDEFFRRRGPGDPRTPGAHEDGMPSKSELLSEFKRQHERVAALTAQLSSEALSRPVAWRFDDRFPALCDYLAFMCVTHEAMHLGQLAAWRRAAGMESALARL